jgi:membrane protease YdiL (CAAX protease family)
MKTVSRIAFLKTMNLIGLKKPSLRGSFYILLCMIIGMVSSFLILFTFSILGGGVLYWTSASLDVLIQNLIVSPIFEELIIRGIYLGVFLKLFGVSYKSAAIALIMSAFTFGWIHPAQPIVKTVGGFLLGSIYLFGWKKNLAESSLTHFGINLVGSFLVVIT